MREKTIIFVRPKSQSRQKVDLLDEEKKRLEPCPKIDSRARNAYIYLYINIHSSSSIDHNASSSRVQ